MNGDDMVFAVKNSEIQSKTKSNRTKTIKANQIQIVMVIIIRNYLVAEY